MDNKNASTKGSGAFWGCNVINSLIIKWMHHCQLDVEREGEVLHCCCIDRTHGTYMVSSARTWKKQIL